MIEIKSIKKIYKLGDHEVHALRGVSLKIDSGDFVAIMGPSGSGKSTMAQILGLLDAPTEGQYLFFGKEISNYSEDELAILRRDQIGFIFQQFNLLPRMTAKQNIELPLLYSRAVVSEGYSESLLKLVGLENRVGHRTNELSGGQQQRVAIARALVNKPKIIFADEPTGNLDSQSEKEILEVIQKLNDDGITVIMVTHEESIGQQAKRLIKMRDGQIVSDVRLRPINSMAGQGNLNVAHTQAPKSLLNDLAIYFNQGLHTLLANKIRSGLSMLGIMIGVAAVVAIMALGNGAQKAMEESLSTMGSNLLVVRSGYRKMGGVTQETGALRLYVEDAEFLKERLSSIKAVSPTADSRGQVAFGNKNWSTQITAVMENYPTVRNWAPMMGRFFTNEENRTRARVCLIGLTLVRELFQNKNPIGENIKINKVSYQVIGVMEEKSGGGWRDQNDIVIVPLETGLRRIFGKESVDSIDVAIADKDQIPMALEQIISLLNERKRVPFSQQQTAFNIMNMADIQKMIEDSNKTMSTLLASVAAISLLVGGIGIMNIMLVSVTERTKEVGLRKSVGAKKQDILLQFLMESIVMSACGGFAGIILGWVITEILSSVTGWTTSISFVTVTGSMIFSSFIGIVFGIYPAHRASKLHPIQALRYE